MGFRSHERPWLFKRLVESLYTRCQSPRKKKVFVSFLPIKEKKEFLSDPKHLSHKGFFVADTTDTGINLMVYPFSEEYKLPKFKECAKHPKVSESGFVLYYTNQCPFTYYWVPRIEALAKEKSIDLKVIHVTDRETAQNVPSPVTTYALFKDGTFLTHAIQSDKKFLKLAGNRSLKLNVKKLILRPRCCL